MGEGYERAKEREEEQFKHFLKAPKREPEEDDLITRSMAKCYEQEFLAKSRIEDFCPDVHAKIVLVRAGDGIDVMYGTTRISVLSENDCPGLNSLFCKQGELITATVSRQCSIEPNVFFFCVVRSNDKAKSNAA